MIIDALSEVGERVKQDLKEYVIEQVVEDLVFVTEKMTKIRKEIGDKKPDIKQMADFHRYSEARWFLSRTLSSLDEDGDEI